MLGVMVRRDKLRGRRVGDGWWQRAPGRCRDCGLFRMLVLSLGLSFALGVPLVRRGGLRLIAFVRPLYRLLRGLWRVSLGFVRRLLLPLVGCMLIGTGER